MFENWDEMCVRACISVILNLWIRAGPGSGPLCAAVSVKHGMFNGSWCMVRSSG